ncbi:MAG: nucleotidyltransferase domain-containing protein, partial [Infirmifilum sp.]
LCILFGSRARKEYDAYSDYDLLIVFENREEMLKSLEKLYETTNKTGFFIQAMPVALEEIDKLNADFVKTVFEEGVVLYQRYPVTTSAFAGPLKAMSIIEYRLDKLTQRKKLKLEYRLHGRKGVIVRAGGYKIGRGVAIVPRENTEIVLKTLRESGAEYKVYNVFYAIPGPSPFPHR